MNGENNNKNDFEKPDSSLNNGENRDNNGQYYNERENFNPYGSFDSRYQNAPYGGYNPAPIGNKRNEVKERVNKTVKGKKWIEWGEGEKKKKRWSNRDFIAS